MAARNDLDWSEDEQLLALDLYFRFNPLTINKKHASVIELSDLLKPFADSPASPPWGEVPKCRGGVIGPPGWLEKGPSASLLVRYVSQRIRSSHPDPFEANGMPPTYETMHQDSMMTLSARVPAACAKVS